jgi:hypothetical protein
VTSDDCPIHVSGEMATHGGLLMSQTWLARDDSGQFARHGCTLIAAFRLWCAGQPCQPVYVMAQRPCNARDP